MTKQKVLTRFWTYTSLDFIDKWAKIFVKDWQNKNAQEWKYSGYNNVSGLSPAFAHWSSQIKRNYAPTFMFHLANILSE